MVATLLPLLVLGVSAYFVSIDAIKKQSSTLAMSIVQEKAANIASLMNQSKSLVQSILSNPRFQSAIIDKDSLGEFDRLATQSMIGDILGNHLHMEGLAGIDVIMLDGRHFHVGEMLESTRLDLLQRDALLSVCEEHNYGLCWPGLTPNILLNSRHGLTIPAIKVLKKLNQSSMKEEPIGMLFLAFSLDSFYERIHSRDAQGVTYVVVDEEWRIIYHPERLRINTRLPEDIRLLLKGENGRTTVLFEEEKSELIYQSLQGANWKLIGVVPTAPLQAMIKEISVVTIFLLLFCVVLAITGMAYINRQIIRPIHLVTEQFDRVKEHNILLPKVTKSELLEIRSLMQGLNDYFETIQKERQQSNELQEAYKTLQDTQKQLVESEKMASLGGLIAGMAHEINTPLGISITAISLLNVKATDIAEKIEKSSVKKTEMIAALKQFVEISQIVLSNLERTSRLVQSFKQTAVDQSIEEIRTFNVYEYLNELVFSLQPQFRGRNIKIKFICKESLELASYPGAIAQVVTNLIMNALIHAYEQESKGEITLDVSEDEASSVVLILSDDGKGIAEENLNKIFEPFFTTKRNKGGTGLGLHIVYNIITQKLKGRISCNSKIGEGTRFEITLPKELSAN